MQSGWEMNFKKHFLGENLQDITMTNVPLIRLRYRQETLEGSIDDLVRNAAYNSKKPNNSNHNNNVPVTSSASGNHAVK